MKLCLSTSVLVNTEHKLPTPLMKKIFYFYAHLRRNKLSALRSEGVMIPQFNNNDAWDKILVIISSKIVLEGLNTFNMGFV
jgi:hypothetical protein